MPGGRSESASPRPRTSAAAVHVSADPAIVFTVVDGRVIEFRGYLDRAAALAAAGVTNS